MFIRIGVAEIHQYLPETVQAFQFKKTGIHAVTLVLTGMADGSCRTLNLQNQTR